MKKVILDTNIYYQFPKRKNRFFHAIKKMADKKLLELYIPYIVEHENKTQQVVKLEKEIEKVVAGLEKIKKFDISFGFEKNIESAIKTLSDQKIKMTNSVKKNFDLWVEEISAVKIPLSIEQTNKAFEAYFSGTLPFKKIKSRDDIPDGFIAEAVKQICQNSEKDDSSKIYFISNDSTMLKSFSNQKNIVVYKSLNDFFDTEEINKELREIDIIDNSNVIHEVIFQSKTDIEHIISNKIGEEIIGCDIIDDSIPCDNNSARISSYWEAENITLDWHSLKYYGDGQFGCNFSLQIDVLAEFYIYKSEYFYMEMEIDVTELNDYVFEAEDDFSIDVSGVILIPVNSEDHFKEDIYIVEEEIVIDEIQEINLIRESEKEGNY